MKPEEADPLAALSREAEPPPELEQRVVATLRSRGLLGRRPGPGRRWVLPAAMAAAAGIFALGLLLGRRSVSPGGSSLPGAPHYVLLLYEDAGFRLPGDPAEFVAEYRAWGARMRAEGHYVAGQKLRDSARLLQSADGQIEAEARDVRTEEGALAGYFVITARDYGEAVALAKTHPHLRHGGRIAIREIEPT